MPVSGNRIVTLNHWLDSFAASLSSHLPAITEGVGRLRAAQGLTSAYPTGGGGGGGCGGTWPHPAVTVLQLAAGWPAGGRAALRPPRPHGCQRLLGPLRPPVSVNRVNRWEWRFLRALWGFTAPRPYVT